MKIQVIKVDRRKITIPELLCGIAILLISSYAFLPLISEKLMSMVPVPVCLLTAIAMILVSKRSFSNADMLFFGGVIAWFLWFSLCVRFGGASVPDIYSTMLLSITLVLMGSLPSARDQHSRLYLVIIIAICASVITTVFISLPYIEANPYIVRKMATGINLYRGYGIGGYEFSYCSAMLTPCLLLFMRSKQLWKKILSLVTLVAICIYSTMCALFTTLIIFISSVSLFLVLQIKNKRVKILLVIVLVVVILLMVLPGSESLADALEDLNAAIDNDILNTKFEDIIISLRGGEEQHGTISGRTSRYGLSLKTFISSPLIGGTLLSNAQTSGGHSTFLDYLAITGLIGTVLFLWLIVIVYKNTAILLKNRLSKAVLWESFTVFLATALIKGVNYMTVFWTVLVVIPMIVKYSDGTIAERSIYESITD